MRCHGVSSRQGALPLRPESFKTFLATGEERPGWARNTVAQEFSTVKRQHTHTGFKQGEVRLTWRFRRHAGGGDESVIRSDG